MLKLDPKWGEDSQSLLQKSLAASDRHFRRRLMALHFVASGNSASRAAAKIGTSRVSVAQWVHRFNQYGIEGLRSQWKGNPGRILTDQELEKLKAAVRQHPRNIGLNQGRWSKDTVVAYVEKIFGKKIHPDTARKYLHLLGFRYRKPDKNFVKADPEKQKAFAQKLEKLEQGRTRKSITVYVDEGSIRQDVLPRKGWFLKAEPTTVDSTSPGKKNSFLRRNSPAAGKSDHHAG